jgi:hypothetical protein
LLQNLIDCVEVLDTSTVEQIGTVEQYLGTQSRESHGYSGFVYLGDLLGGKVADLCNARLLARLHPEKIPAYFP